MCLHYKPLSSCIRFFRTFMFKYICVHFIKACIYGQGQILITEPYIVTVMS